MDKLKSFLGNPSELRGDLVSGGILRLDGVVVGNIRADEVILSETASIQGEVAANKIIVGGRMDGTLRAADVVEIRAKGRVDGTIVTKRIVLASGGEFSGRIEMGKQASGPPSGEPLANDRN
ncbi:MAG: polymer-forming cytoskeletal protein [Acidobacteriota bacterium]|jgi:cytoskeletal protein CcmA (bactofilin family)|nr:polymer-forming cytoskeletal protein [Acidobacteriota bacterium]